MGRSCCVPGCKSNYYQSGVPAFAFPKNQSLREKWIKNIRRYNFEYTDKTVVCAKHFEPEFVIREDFFPIIDGEPIRVPRKIPRLSYDAVPTIFPDENVVSKRKKRIPSTCEESQLQEAFQGQKENHVKLRKDIGSLDVSGTEHGTPEVPMPKRKRSAKLKLERSGRLGKLVHFDENQFESHRLDGQRKLKPFAVPTIFNTAGPNDGQTKVESLEQHEPEVTFHKQIKIESVISLSGVARALSAASNVTQKRKAGRPRSSKKKSTIQQRRTSARISVRGRRKWTNFYKEEYETNTQSKKIQNKLRNTCPKEVRVVVERIPRRSVQSTSEKGPSKKKISQRTGKITPGKGPSKERIRRRSVQSSSEKGPSKERTPRRSEQSTLEEGASRVRIPRRRVQSTLEEGPSKDRIPQPTVQSASRKQQPTVQSTSRKPQPTVQSSSEESASKEAPSETRESSSMPSKKRSRSSTGTKPKPRPRKILRIDDENEETQVNCGLENSQDDAAEGEKVSGNCIVCNNYVEQGTVLTTLTNVSKEHFHEKLNRLVVGQDAITVKKDGVLCSVCTRLLNYMDRIEVELSMLKTALINCMRKKRVLKQDTNSSGQNHHDSSDGSSKIDDPPPLILDCTEEDSEPNDIKETLPDDGDEHIADTDNHVDISSPEPVTKARCDRLEQPDPSNDAAISKESKTKTSDKEYKCKMCLFKTCYKSVMIFHLRQHVKDKFRCDFCNLNIAEDSEHIKHMLALPPYLRHKKRVIHFKAEKPVSNTNTDSVVKRDVSADSANVKTEVLPDNVVKVNTSDCKASSLHKTNTKLLGNGNVGTEMFCNVKVLENMSVLKPKRTVVKKIICRTNKNLVNHDLKSHPPEAK